MMLSTSGRQLPSCARGSLGETWCAHPGRSRHAVVTVLAAKKGKKGGGNKKGGGGALAGLLKKKAAAEQEAASQRATPKQYADPEVRGMLFELCTSYHNATKQFLLDEVDLDTLAQAMFNAPFVCVAHDRAPGVDVPRYTYANRAGLDCFDCTWDEFVGMDSTKSTPPVDEDQEVRAKLLAEAEQNDTGYSVLPEGKRVTLRGKLITIKNVTLFNILDFSGEQTGQAAVFDEYELEDGTAVKVTATEWEAAPEDVDAKDAVVPPSPEEMEEAQAAVDEWAVYIRTLKEEHGRGNKDEDVMSAVEQLKLRKEYLAALQQRQEDALKASMAAFGDDD